LFLSWPSRRPRRAERTPLMKPLPAFRLLRPPPEGFCCLPCISMSWRTIKIDTTAQSMATQATESEKSKRVRPIDAILLFYWDTQSDTKCVGGVLRGGGAHDMDPHEASRAVVLDRDDLAPGELAAAKASQRVTR